MDPIRQLSLIIGLGHEMTPGRNSLFLRSSGRHENVNPRPTGAHYSSKLDTIQFPGHIYVRKNHLHILSLFQDLEGLVRIFGLEHLEMPVREKIGNHNTRENFVLDHKHCRARLI